MEGKMNSGYEGSLPEALGKRIAIIGFFIVIVSFLDVIAVNAFVCQGKVQVEVRQGEELVWSTK